MIPPISSATIAAALTRFDREQRHTTAWYGWERNPTHKLALRTEGRLYPIKQIVTLAAQASGLPAGSASLEEVRQYLQAQGWEIVPLSAGATGSSRPLAASIATPRAPASTPSSPPALLPPLPAAANRPRSFADYVGQFEAALTDEISTLRANGGQKTSVTDGHYLGARDGRYLYAFSADVELYFPDDTPVDLEVRGHKYEGWIISVAGFDLILALETQLGARITVATLYTAPWFLLEELKKRLTGATHNAAANCTLAEALLHPQAAADPVDSRHARTLLIHVGARQSRPVGPNEDQIRAVARIIERPVTYVWGPPGTGKTRTLGLAVAALVEAGETVLITAHSNAAVDVAMLQVAPLLQDSFLYTAGRVLRYGGARSEALQAFPQLHVRGVARQSNPELVQQIESLEQQLAWLVQQARTEDAILSATVQNQMAAIKATLAPLKAELQQKERELVQVAAVVGCTLSKATIAPEIYSRHFTTVIVDEASMAYIPHCAWLTTLATRAVAMFGDFRQLAPITQAETAATTHWLGRDVFDEAGIRAQVDTGQEVTDSRLILLRTQYRMHSAIAEVPNRLFYGGQLRHGPHVDQNAQPIIARAPHAGQVLVLQDMTALGATCDHDPESHSRFNLYSALVAVSLAADGCRGTPTEWNSTKPAPAATPSIGIITPYNAQARLIHRLLKDTGLREQGVRVATVHRFQGSEQDIIIFDAVDAPPLPGGKLLVGGLGSTAQRLANVAISRARGKFIGLFHAGHTQTNLTSADSLRQVFEAITAQEGMHSLPRIPGSVPLQIPGLTYYTSSAQAKTALEADLGGVKEEVVIYWPHELAPHHFPITAFQQCNPDQVRFFITTQANGATFAGQLQNTRIWVTSKPKPFGAVGLDRKCLWLYLTPENPYAPVLRLALPETSKLLYAFWRLIPDAEIKHSTLAEKLAQGQSPVGLPCSRCGGFCWPGTGRYGVALLCTQCGYTKSINAREATELARLMSIRCGRCGQQVAGRRGANGTFLGCTNYPTCTWTQSLESLI